MRDLALEHAQLEPIAAASARGVLQVGMGWFGEEPGGLNRMYAGLLRAMVATGVPVEGVIAGDPNAAVGVPPNVRFFAPREAGLVRRLRACRALVRERLQHGEIGLVAAHFAPYALPLLDLLRSRPFVFHFHGPWAAESRLERRRGANVVAKSVIERAVYRRADRFVVLSQAFADVLMRSYGADGKRIRIVPGGVDAARFAPRLSRTAARVALGIPTDRAVIGVVRRLVHRMGLEGLIDAMQSVRKAAPEALLLVAGRGPLAASLAARVAAAGLADYVVFLGFVGDEQLPQFYRACDVSIVPSVALEGFGLTTIESLAAGTPVLVTPVGGLPETVRALDDGLVLPDATPAAMARALVDVLRDARLLPTAEHCAQYARSRFDWPVVAAKVLSAYA